MSDLRALSEPSSPQSPRLEKARKDAQFLNDFSNRISTLPRSLGTEQTSENLRSLVRDRKNYGDQLLRAGAVLLVIPDPVTSTAAIPVLAAGKAMKSRQSCNLKDVYQNLSETVTSLARVSSLL